MRLGGQKWKKSKIKIWNLEEKEKFLLWKYAYFSRNMKGKVIYKPFFIFFVYPLRGPSPVGKLTLKNLKTHFSFYLYIYTPKLGVAIILKGFFVFMTHPTVQLTDTSIVNNLKRNFEIVKVHDTAKRSCHLALHVCRKTTELS